MLGLHGGPDINGMSGMSGGASGGLLAGISPDHLPALFAPLLVLPAVWLFLLVARKAAGAGYSPARRFLHGYERTSLVQRVFAVLLLVTAFIHLGLIPGHATDAPKLARLFAVNGLLFVAAALAVFTWRWWRPAAGVLLVLTLLAYLSAISKGQESVDQLGIATKLVELAALGLLLLPSPRAIAARHGTQRRTLTAAALLGATVVTGVGIWGAELKPNITHAADAATVGQDGLVTTARTGNQLTHDVTGMVMQQVPLRPPTQAENAAAVKLAAATKTAIARYDDVAVALADGYRPSTSPKQSLIHYANKAYAHDGRVLDPAQPEDLVYANTAHGLVLMGAMFMTEGLGAAGPDPAGPLVQWHRHTSLCFGAGPAIDGLLSPFGTCPAGTINVATPAMLHIWTAIEPARIGGEAPPVPTTR